MRSNKKLIIVINIVLALAVVSAVIVCLYFMTDIFKSNKELFSKYFSQNTETFEKIINLQTIEIYENLNNKDKYESNTNIEITHSVGGEVSDPLNNLNAKLNIQKDGNQYWYADAKVLYEDEEYLELEAIKEQKLYGIRFTNAVQQFITVKNDEKLDTITSDIGINSEQIKTMMNIIDGKEETSISGIVTSLKEKYFNIINTAISNGKFEKQKNAMITYNNSTIETNAYSVELSSEQVRRMVMEILNNEEEATSIINEQNEMPTVKITVYVKEKQTVRTIVDIGLYKIIIENIEQNGKIKTKINYIDNKDSIKADAEINKNNATNEENLEMTIDVEEKDKSYTINLSTQIKEVDGQIQLNAKVSHKEGITQVAMALENNVEIVNNIRKMQTLDSKNNIVLNTTPDAKRKEFIDILKQLVKQETNVRVDLLKRRLQMLNDETVETEQSTQIEINKFNSKFEFYTGEEVSSENVKKLLEIVKNHMASYEDIKIETQENGEANLEDDIVDDKLNIKLDIEKDIYNEDAANKILEKISETKKYKVSIHYKENNGLIDYITITEL